MRLALRGAGLPEKKFAGQFQNRCSNDSFSSRGGGFHHSSPGTLEEFCISVISGQAPAASGCLTHYCTHRQNLLRVRGVGYSSMSIFHHVILYVIVIVSVHANQDLVGRLRNGNMKVGRLPLMVQTVLQSIVPPPSGIWMEIMGVGSHPWDHNSYLVITQNP